MKPYGNQTCAVNISEFPQLLHLCYLIVKAGQDQRLLKIVSIGGMWRLIIALPASLHYWLTAIDWIGLSFIDWLIWNDTNIESFQTSLDICSRQMTDTERESMSGGQKSKSDVFLNHYTASPGLCVTLSLPPSVANCQMSTLATTKVILWPCGQITVLWMISRHFYGW